MNKLLIAGVVSIGVTAIIWLVFVQNKTIERPNILDNPANEESAGKDAKTDGSDPEKTGENSFTGTIKELLTKQTSMKCTAEYILESGKQNSTIYSDGKNTRMESIAVINGKENKVYVVIKDGWEYIWNDLQIEGMPAETTGMKIRFSELDKPDVNEGANPSEMAGINMAKPMDFSCQPWTANSTLFDLPSDIEFNDYTAQTNDLLKNAPASACDACKMMPTSETKAMCEQQNCKAGE